MDDVAALITALTPAIEVAVGIPQKQARAAEAQARAAESQARAAALAQAQAYSAAPGPTSPGTVAQSVGKTVAGVPLWALAGVAVVGVGVIIASRR